MTSRSSRLRTLSSGWPNSRQVTVRSLRSTPKRRLTRAARVRAAFAGEPEPAFATGGDALEVEVAEALVGRVDAADCDPPFDQRRPVADVDLVDVGLREVGLPRSGRVNAAVYFVLNIT